MSSIVRKVISTKKCPKAVAPYSQAIVADRTVYCSGVLGMELDTLKLVPGGAAAQTAKALEHLTTLLSEAGSGIDKVVKTTVLIGDMNDYATVNEEYKKDEIVMQACNKYMNSICGEVLEKRTDDNYEIIVGDCMVYLKKYIKEERKFDYVFGDLTDIPISDTPTGEIWDFIRLILESSFQVLKPDGKFMTHGNGVSCPESLRMYEDQLAKLTPKVKYTKSSAFVPSFMEEWVFYQVQREVASATESV